MAKKYNAGADSTELLTFDQRTKAVSARAHTMDNMKEKISKVREVAPSSSKDDIIQVLHHFDGDVDKSIEAYKKDGAQEILSQWNIPNRKGKGGNNQSKRNKKKKHKGGQQNDVALTNGGDIEPTVPNNNNNNIDKPTHSRIESTGHSNGHEPNNNMPKDNPVQPLRRREPNIRSRREDPKPRQQQQGNKTGASRSPRREPPHPSDNQSSGQRDVRGRERGDAKSSEQQQRTSPPKSDKQRGQPNSRPSQQQQSRQHKISEGSDSGVKVGGDRERTISESSTSQDKNKPKKPGSVLERVSKDLQRTQVSLIRHKNLLNEECDRSEKRLRKAFEDIRQCLEHREMEMMRQLKEVKRQSTILLENRQEKALELKMETAKAASMSDHQLSELRADIKHFVSERKIDEEIGRTMRFTWNPDPVEQSIKSLGEVMPIKTTYATRRPSITSDTSGTFSRTTSVSEDPSGPLSRSTSRIDSSVPPTPTTPDMDMNAEVAHFAARLQKSLDSRGGPRRPRNDRSRSQGRQGAKKEQQRGPKNQGGQQQEQPKGNQQQGRRNRGGPPNRGGGGGGSKEQGAPNRRNRERVSSSSSTGKGEESPEGSPKKSRSARRREQYRRRHLNQDKDGVEENENSKPVAKDASPTNKDSQPKTNEKEAAKEVIVDSSDSKQKEVVDSNDIKPVVNGMPSPESKTKTVDDEDAGQPNGIDSDTKPNRPKELNITLNGPKEKEIVENHIEKDVHPKATPVMNGYIHTEEDKPMVNGISSGGDISPAEHAKESSEALPQRHPRERKERQKPSTEVVKEVSAMNGVIASGDQTPVNH